MMNDEDWSKLPEDLLTMIGKRFQSLDDILRFRSVCLSFRSSLSLPPKTLIPVSARRRSFKMDTTNHNRYVLTESTVYAIEPLLKISNTHGTTQTWLVKIEESDRGKIRIKDPLSGFRFRNLPNRLPESLNLLNYRVKEVNKAYKLELVSKRKASSFSKVVASACLDSFVVMGIYKRSLFVWRAGYEKLTKLQTDDNDFLDIIFHDEKFYALRIAGHTITFDSTSFNITQVVLRPPNWNGLNNFLVNSLNDLLLVHSNALNKFRVCKLDKEKNEWVPVVNGLEDRVLFVSHRDCSFSVSAQEFSECEGNCIYWNTFKRSESNCKYPGSIDQIFNLKDYTFGWLSDFPRYSKIFWPPPTWLRAPPHPPRD